MLQTIISKVIESLIRTVKYVNCSKLESIKRIYFKSICRSEICSKVFNNNQNLNRHVRTIHEKVITLFSCTECDYSTSHQDNLQKHLRKRCNNTPTTQILSPKIACHEPIPNIIEPTENEQLIRDIEQQELSDMLNNQTGLGLSQIPPTQTTSSPLPDNNNNDPRQYEFEHFIQTE